MTIFPSKATVFPGMEPHQWPHKPGFVQLGCSTEITGLADNLPHVPLGIPFEDRKHRGQIVIQGRFKRSLKISEVYFGSGFYKPLARTPSPSEVKVMGAVIQHIAPGVILDLLSSIPKALVLLAGAAQTMSIDTPGNEPDITAPVIEENIATESKRKRHLGNPKKADMYELDPEHIYNFHVYDNLVDFGRATLQIPVYGEYDMKPTIGRQSQILTAVTKSGE
ncbi:hypothetical protein ACHAWF_000822, partial [Thalassiosira exigua]